MLRIKEDKQVDVGKTSLLELNGVNISYSSAKETIINELEKCFLLLLKDIMRVLRTRKLHKKRRVIEDLVTTLRVEPAFVPILSFKLKGLRSRLGSQEVREKKKLIEVLSIEEQS